MQPEYVVSEHALRLVPLSTDIETRACIERFQEEVAVWAGYGAHARSEVEGPFVCMAQRRHAQRRGHARWDDRDESLFTESLPPG